MAVARHLRYSPVNWLIVDWSASGQAFSNCGLPKPVPCLTGGEACGASCTHPLPVQEAIDTYDWDRFLPEVIVGIDDPDEEIAANYVRAAAIEFAKGSRCLQREIVVELQPGIDTYPVMPYAGEQIIGVLGLRSGNHPCCSTGGGLTGIYTAGGFQSWRLDTARNELQVLGVSGTGLLRVLVWAAPTEDACVYDRFLYDTFRSDITLGARREYGINVHFRDRALLNVLPTQEAISRAIVLAKKKAVALPSSWPSQPGNTFGGGRGCTLEDYYFHRS